jgi:protein involved in polysaccharide export with SLBB domain
VVLCGAVKATSDFRIQTRTPGANNKSSNLVIPMKKVLLIGIVSLLALAAPSGVHAQTGSNTAVKAVEKSSETNESSTNAPTSSKTTPAVSPANEKPGAAVRESNTMPAGAGSADPTIASAPVSKPVNDPAPVNKSGVTDDAGLTYTYTVGVGDVLDIRLLNSASNRSTLYSVIEGGLIDLPIAGGPIAVVGLTTKDIQARITAELKRLAVADRTQVAVGVRQYASHAVIITGLVGNPGTKFLRREAVPLYVLLAEVQPRLDATRAAIMRAGEPTQMLELNDSAALNFLVRPGDVINLTARPQEFYYIGGRVNYPGQKDFHPGITLIQAILAAGGSARDNEAELSREGTDGKLTSTKFNLKEIKAGKTEDPKLEPGDRVEVLH